MQRSAPLSRGRAAPARHAAGHAAARSPLQLPRRRLHHHPCAQPQGGAQQRAAPRSSRSSGGEPAQQQPRTPGPSSSSSSSPARQQPDLSVYSWRTRLPGDSGWDLLQLRRRDPKAFNRIREVEVVHARWAMLGVLALLLADVGGSPFPPKEASLAALAPWGVVLLLALALVETYRLAANWGEEDFEQRTYPGKRFDVLGLTKGTPRGEPEQPPGVGVFASWLGGLPGWLAGGWWFDQQAHQMTEVQLLELKSKELRNGRLAMVSFIGCCMASALTGKGPITLLMQHLADPAHNTIVQALQ